MCNALADTAYTDLTPGEMPDYDAGVKVGAYLRSLCKPSAAKGK